MVVVGRRNRLESTAFVRFPPPSCSIGRGTWSPRTCAVRRSRRPSPKCLRDLQKPLRMQTDPGPRRLGRFLDGFFQWRRISTATARWGPRILRSSSGPGARVRSDTRTRFAVVTLMTTTGGTERCRPSFMSYGGSSPNQRRYLVHQSMISPRRWSLRSGGPERLMPWLLERG